MAETLEESPFTSIQRRMNTMSLSEPGHQSDAGVPTENEGSPRASPPTELPLERPDCFLSPVQIDELKDALGARPSASPARCSDKGFVTLGVADYVQLLDWTARQLAPDKLGATPAGAPPVFERLKLRSEVWCELVRNFGIYFSLVAGQPHCVDGYRSRVRRQRFHLKARARDLLAV